MFFWFRNVVGFSGVYHFEMSDNRAEKCRGQFHPMLAFSVNRTRADKVTATHVTRTHRATIIATISNNKFQLTFLSSKTKK